MEEQGNSKSDQPTKNRLKPGEKRIAPVEQVRGTTLRLTTWNAEGFNTTDRILETVSYLWRCKVDIAILTESLLKDDDMIGDRGEGEDRVLSINLDHYNIANWRNRGSEAGWRCGGVLMLTRAGVDCVLAPQDLLPKRPASCRSLIVTAIGGRCQPFHFTGIYLPPTHHGPHQDE